MQILFDFPPKTITDQLCSDSMSLQASKHIRHQSIDRQLFDRSTTVVAKTEDVHIVKGSTGTVVAFQAAINGTIATGGDRVVTVDLQRSTGGGAFATILSSTIQFTSASTLRTAVSAVLTTTPYQLVANDILAVVVTVAGSASAQALGLLCTITTTETYA